MLLLQAVNFRQVVLIQFAEILDGEIGNHKVIRVVRITRGISVQGLELPVVYIKLGTANSHNPPLWPIYRQVSDRRLANQAVLRTRSTRAKARGYGVHVTVGPFCTFLSRREISFRSPDLAGASAPFPRCRRVFGGCSLPPGRDRSCRR